MAYTTLQSLFTGICDALRTKKNTTALINHQDIPNEILNLPVKTNEYYVEDVSGASYNFTKASDGYWTRTNQGITSSASVCKVVFDMVADGTITFNCINYAEGNYDYGIIGALDTDLSTGYSSSEYNTTSVQKHFRGSQSASVQTYSMTVTEGEHYVWVKYVKDSSQDSNDDMFKFTISGAEEVEAPEKGVDVSGVTATATDVLDGKYFVDSSGVLTEGTMPSVSMAMDLTYNSSTGYIEAPVYVLKNGYAQTTDSMTAQKTPAELDSNFVAENIKSGVSICGVDGSLTGYNRYSTTFTGTGSSSGQTINNIPSKPVAILISTTWETSGTGGISYYYSFPNVTRYGNSSSTQSHTSAMYYASYDASSQSLTIGFGGTLSFWSGSFYYVDIYY